MFCYSLRKQAAAIVAVLGGVDQFVFTAALENWLPAGPVLIAVFAGFALVVALADPAAHMSFSLRPAAGPFR